MEGGGARDGERCADVAGGVADHKGGFGGRESGGSNDEVALILAGGIVEDNDKLVVGYSHGGLVGLRQPRENSRGIAEGQWRTHRMLV